MTISIRWLGHSAFLLDIDGHSVLIDPFLTGNPLAAAQPENLSPEFILLSHAHGDHLGDTVDIAKANNIKVVCNFEISNYMAEHEVDAIGMNPGGKADLGFMTIKFTQAIHSSSFPDGRYGGAECGFVIHSHESDKKIYFAGDTALFSDMSLIGDMNIDVAILPIGDFFTMGPDDSIRAIEFLRPRYVLPMHYNTFPPIVQDASAWAARVNNETRTIPVVIDPGGEYQLT